MKHLSNSLLLLLVLMVTFQACKKNDSPHDDHEDTSKEYKHIRLLVSDGTSREITQVDPSDGSTSTFEAAHPNATLYATGSKRFGALLFGTQNFVQFFDCGLEYHGDHVDVKGTPKFASMTAEEPKPTHFKSRGEETIIFNDGDGTLSVGEEGDFHIAGATMRVINANLDPHHGAMAQFDNGTYAVTFKDNASGLSGPHGVKIINAQGHEVYPSTVPVSRLHGNATDGNNAVFGVAGGVLVVNKNGTQKMINNPEGFGDIRLGTILEAAGSNQFIGFVATKGAYLIDVNANTIIPIIENTNIMQCKVDYTGKNLLTLLFDGTLKIYDLHTGTMKKEAVIIGATAATDSFKPVLESTTRFAYIIIPSLGELHQVDMNDLSKINKIRVTAQPVKLAILGYETNESH